MLFNLISNHPTQIDGGGSIYKKDTHIVVQFFGICLWIRPDVWISIVAVRQLVDDGLMTTIDVNSSAFRL